MDVIKVLTASPHKQSIQCIDMHTTGEPTRIILSGHPDLTGTLLEQRAQAHAHYDHIRQRLMLEPRGHGDMYGALLRPDTELVRNDSAHIGVLFMTNGGYSTMCGHATIALGRFLIDTWDLNVFPKRGDVQVDMKSLTARVNLHPPCGLVEVDVPVMPDGQRSDPTRPVSFVCVPSFATGMSIEIEVPSEKAWPELTGRRTLKADFSYGGTFYCMVDAVEMGFVNGLRKVDFDAINRATKLLKAAIVDNPSYKYLFKHPDHDGLSFLYSIMVVDKTIGQKSEGSDGAETGLCFFSDQQLDRSPTGSAVAAREALAVAKAERTVGQRWTYHSLVSNASSGKGGFDSEIVSIEDRITALPLVRVRVAGYAYYTGTSTFVVEKEDVLGEGGFLFKKLAA